MSGRPVEVCCAADKPGCCGDECITVFYVDTKLEG